MIYPMIRYFIEYIGSPASYRIGSPVSHHIDMSLCMQHIMGPLECLLFARQSLYPCTPYSFPAEVSFHMRNININRKIKIKYNEYNKKYKQLKV